MSNYGANNSLGGSQQSLSGTFKTLLALTAQTTGLRRAWIYDLMFGCDGTPADGAADYDASRQTAAGTSTAVTPTPDDPADAAAATVASANFTAEGTITAASSAIFIAANTRATVRWVASEKRELVIPATNLAGFAFRAKATGYTSTAACMVKFRE